jgi:hypothetical protein
LGYLFNFHRFENLLFLNGKLMALFYTKDRSTRLTFVSAGLLCTLALSTNLFLSQKAFAAEGQSLEIIAQQTSGNTKSPPKATNSTSSNEIQKKIDEFNQELKEFKEKKLLICVELIRDLVFHL